MFARAFLIPLCGVLVGGALACAQERPIPLPDKDFEALKKCAEGTGTAQIDACNGYLEAYPGSSGVQPVLEILLTAYDHAHDSARLLATADRLLSIDRANLRALAFETSLRIQSADQLTDLRAKRDELAKAVRYARIGLEVEKPVTTSATEWDELRDATRPVFQAALTRARLWGLSVILEESR